MAGTGNRRKKYQKRYQQREWTHAIRNEGIRRNAIFNQLKSEKENDKVREVYRQYGEMLQQKALKQQQQQQQAEENMEESAPAEAR